MLKRILWSGVDPLHSVLTAFRREIHKHPELGFEEVRTQDVVRRWLIEHGYTPRVCAETGLVADLNPESEGRTIALRADLDALPMPETTDLPYRSVHDGRAHKCGHDGHTAIMMGVAAALAAQRDKVPGNVRIIFQPAEEGVRGGGAKVMVAEGALEGVEEAYGLHNWPGFPKGHVYVQPGPVMAQVNTFNITINGVGGHGSQPQGCRDPIVAGAHLVTALQTVVSRGLGYDGGAVVSVCQFEAGSTHNVIPSIAKLKGTIRSFIPQRTERVLERVREVTAGVASTFGIKIDLDIEPGYPVLNNADEPASVVARVARDALGEDKVSSDGLPLGAGEDFAYFAEVIPSAYFFLGAGVPGQKTPGCHHPDFDFDDDLIPIGVKVFLGIVADRLTGGD
ncbi:MAG: amidohydrolase [Myxococcota bacterium]